MNIIVSFRSSQIYKEPQVDESKCDNCHKIQFYFFCKQCDEYLCISCNYFYFHDRFRVEHRRRSNISICWCSCSAGWPAGSHRKHSILVTVCTCDVLRVLGTPGPSSPREVLIEEVNIKDETITLWAFVLVVIMYRCDVARGICDVARWLWARRSCVCTTKP